MEVERRRPGLDLRVRIAVVAIAVFVPFVAGLGYFSIRYFERRYEEDLGRAQFQLATRVAADLDRRLAFALETLGKIAEAVGPATLADPAAGQKFLDERITLHVLFDDGLALVSNDGRLLVESPRGTASRGLDVSSDEAYQALFQDGRPTISTAYRSPRGGRSAITMAVPIRDRSRRVIGQLHGAAVLNGPNVAGDLASIPIGERGYFVLLDRDRLRLAHPDPARNMAKVLPGTNRAVDKAIEEGFEGVVETVSTTGLRVLSAAKRLSTVDWILFANVPMDEIRRPFVAALPLYAVWFAAGAMVLVLALWQVLRRLTAPLEATIAAVERIAAHPAPGQRVGGHGVGQVARLGATFDALLDVLESRGRELQVGEERFRALFQQSPFMMLLVDPDGPVIDANDTFLAYAGLRREEVVGRTGDELGLVPRAERVARMAALDAGETVPAKERTVTLGGIERQVRFSIRKIEIEERPVVLVVLKDVTEQRKAEADRRGLEEQLQQQQRLESLGVLAGGIAHDFNNLLTPIIANAGLALEELPKDHPCRADMEQIVDAARRGADLTKRILAFGRRQVLERRVVDLNAEVRSLEKMLRRTIGEDVELVVECAPEPVPVEADPTQLQQMLVNLAVNAREAMPKGGRLAVSRTEGAAPPGAERPGSREAIVTVSDTGVGIEPSVLPRIFEPFFTTKPKDKGTGLGLSTVLGIAQQHGGRVSVESAPGKGSAFRIALPVAEAPIARRDGPIDAVRRRGRRLRVVLVEDEPLVRALAERILRRDGHEVIAAGSPGAALAVPEEPRPDLLLSDVVLPGMDGIELHRRMLARWPGLPVLFMSGFPAGHADVKEAIAHGKHFLQKPFGSQELLERVRETLR